MLFKHLDYGILLLQPDLTKMVLTQVEKIRYIAKCDKPSRVSLLKLYMNCKCFKAIMKDNVSKTCPNIGITQMLAETPPFITFRQFTLTYWFLSCLCLNAPLRFLCIPMAHELMFS